MTLRQNDVIYMGSDSAFATGMYEDIVVSTSDPQKVICVPVADSDDQVLIAVAGDAAVLCELISEFDGTQFDAPPSFKEVRAKIDAVLDPHKLWAPFESGGSNHTVILVALRDKLYRIENKYTWLGISDEVHAVGSGADLALGAFAGSMHTRSVYELPPNYLPADQLTLAMGAAAKYDIHVKPPFYLTSTCRLRDEEK